MCYIHYLSFILCSVWSPLMTIFLCNVDPHAHVIIPPIRPFVKVGLQHPTCRWFVIHKPFAFGVLYMLSLILLPGGISQATRLVLLVEVDILVGRVFFNLGDLFDPIDQRFYFLASPPPFGFSPGWWCLVVWCYCGHLVALGDGTGLINLS